VDTRSEIREFLTTRRARVTPEQAGLRTYGTGPRRVQGPRREEVALSGVSETVLEAQALNPLASWTATPDEETANGDHQEQPRLERRP
jgi:hypothetical protein